MPYRPPDSILKPPVPLTRHFSMLPTRASNIRFLLAFALAASAALGAEPLDLTQRYLLLATSRTTTMQKEQNEAAAAGYRVLSGAHQTGDDGDGQLMVLLEKVARPPDVYTYHLLATERTTTMQRELDQFAAQGFRLLPGSMIGGKGELVLLLENVPGASAKFDYLLLATNRTGTLQKELSEAAGEGYQVVGMVSRHENIVIMERARN